MELSVDIIAYKLSYIVLDDYPPNLIYEPATKIDPQIAVIHGHFLTKKYHNLFPEKNKLY